MEKVKGVIRLEPYGPTRVGLEPMELDPKDFQSEFPKQHIHVYFEDAALGLTVGVWTTTDMREAFGPYPGDEFMAVLEGRVIMIDGDGRETPVETGQNFMIRNAIPISWKQVGFLRKFFITYLDPKAPTPDILSADGGVIVFEPDTLEAGMAPEAESIGGGSQRDCMVFTNDTGNMNVGMWDSTAFESVMQPFSVHEFAQILEGEITITEEDGTCHQLRAGDAAFIPAGTVCSWKAESYLKKYYASVDPST